MEYFDYLKCSGGGGAKELHPPAQFWDSTFETNYCLNMTLFPIFTQCQDSQKCLQS